MKPTTCHAGGAPGRRLRHATLPAALARGHSDLPRGAGRGAEGGHAAGEACCVQACMRLLLAASQVAPILLTCTAPHPEQVHEIAERQLAAAASAAPGAPWQPAVPCGCLLRRVAADASRPGALESALEAAGLRGDRLSVWAWPAGGSAGAYASDPGTILGAIARWAVPSSKRLCQRWLPCCCGSGCRTRVAMRLNLCSKATRCTGN